MKMKKRSGFTLVEILVVAAIIGILASIIITGLEGVRAKGRDARRISEVKQIQGAIENFFVSCYRFPDDLSELETTPGNCPNYKPVLAEVPTNPGSSSADYRGGPDYLYYTGNPSGATVKGLKYHVCAYLEFPYGGTRGKANLEPFETGGTNPDPCEGTDPYVFDAVGGSY